MKLVLDDIALEIGCLKNRLLSKKYTIIDEHDGQWLLQYISPHIETPLNTRIYIKLDTLRHFEMKEKIKVQLNEDMGKLKGFVSLNDMLTHSNVIFI
jgi:hypothetical protein